MYSLRQIVQALLLVFAFRERRAMRVSFTAIRPLRRLGKLHSVFFVFDVLLCFNLAEEWSRIQDSKEIRLIYFMLALL